MHLWESYTKLRLTYSLIVKRKAFILQKSENGRKAICIDSQNASTLLEFLNKDERHKKKFRYISELILRNLRNTELYNKENINKKAKNITAMKFFKGQENARIYCKEQKINNKLFIVVCCELIESKKTQSNNKLIRSLIDKIASYEYEIEE